MRIGGASRGLMGESEACRDLAFIVEGATEKVFHLEYLSQLCAAKGLALRKDLDTQEDRYAITSANGEKVVDLAAKADIEDVMLCDLPGVLSFLGLPPETEMPPGNKGKTKLKKLYRKVAPNKAYHSGERAKDLISHLDMAEIRASAPVPLGEIDRAVVSG